MRKLIVVPLLVAGCAAVPAAEQGPSELDRLLEGRVAAETRTCVSTQGGSNLTPVDGQSIAYRDGATIWVNRLAATCPGLSPGNSLIVEPSGSQYCRGDRIRTIEPGRTIPGPTCILGDFTAYRAAG